MKPLKTLSKALLIIAAILLTSACCTRQVIRVPEYVDVPELPDPILPKLTKEQENAIDLETYLILVERDETLRQHINRINQLIKIHNSANDLQNN